jgi:hypothetical protein
MTELVDAIFDAHGGWCNDGIIGHCGQCRRDDELTSLLISTGVDRPTDAHFALVGGTHPALVAAILPQRMAVAA